VAAAREAHVDALIARCHAGLDAVSLRDEVLRRLRRMVPIDAAFFATLDPETLLMTSVHQEDPLGAMAAHFLENEYGSDDVNKFAVLARSADPVSSLDRATQHERTASPRYLDVMAPLGLGDELRVAFMSKGRCWGAMCLHRADGPGGFTPTELDVVRRIAPHVGDGLRRAVLVQMTTTAAGELAGPGVVVLGADMAVRSMNVQAERWLSELGHEDAGTEWELPLSLYVAARVAHRSAEHAAEFSSTVRLRTARGDWVTVHASPLRGTAGPETSLVLEPTRPVHLASLFLDAQGLTPAQTRVASLVLQGLSTKEIVRELRISAYTVQEHLGVVFDRFGVGSRRELVAALLSGAS
jgi:DNA-binding CsgD family transcriptional regulator/GAF domain-containing protein